MDQPRLTVPLPKLTSCPIIPSYVQRIEAQDCLKHEFKRPLVSPLSSTSAALLVQAALALIIGRMEGSEHAVLGICTQNKTVPLTLEVRMDQKVQGYLQMVRDRTKKEVHLQEPHENGVDFNQVAAFGAQFALSSSVVDISVLSSTLLLRLHHEGVVLYVTANYDSRVIGTWIIAQMLQRLELVAHQLNESAPDRELKDINMVTANEQEMVWKLNDTVPKEVPKCAHQLIMENVKTRPDAPAVNAWDGDFTYGQLGELASRLASKLVTLGVTADRLVPICFEKSKWTQVAALAVLEAGGGFVLLDSTLPALRLQIICSQLGSELVLSSKANLALCATLAPQVFCVHLESIEALEHSPRTEKGHQTQSACTAMYAVFTSGSTGSPKGVVITHANFCTALHYQLEPFGYTRESRSFDFSSYAFDVATYNMMATFVSGGCLCVPKEKDRRERLSESMKSFCVTTAMLTPTVARLLDPTALTDMKTIMLLGEPVLAKDAEPWWFSCKVINVYGPAECVISTANSTAKTFHEVTHIGKGLGHVCWVVDPKDHNRLLPPGFVGELLMEGPIVGRGYLNKPEQTAKSFISDPEFLTKGTPSYPGRSGRLYKSGDLVRYNNTDGALSYVGRVDTQVKIRGQRVELSEIELHADACISGVQQAVAEVVEPKGGNTNAIIAVFVQFSHQTDTASTDARGAQIVKISDEALQKFEERLPNYMVPSAIFCMPVIPSTPTGKVDRKRLRDIGGSFSASELAAYRTAGPTIKRQPADVVEKKLQDIWCKIFYLQPEEVGMDDDFASIGGNSLTAMYAVAAARRALIKLQVADILQNRTIARISKNIAVAKLAKLNGDVPNGAPSALESDFLGVCKGLLGVQAGDIEAVFACSPIQDYILGVQNRDNTNYRLCLGFEVQLSSAGAGLDLDRLEEAWRELVKRHGMLRTTFIHCHAGSMIRRYAVTLKSVNPSVSYLAMGQEAKARDVRNNGGPIYKTNGPQHHLTICKVNETKAFLQLQINHAVFDGYSIDIFCRDLRAAYHGNLGPVGKYGDFIRYLQGQDHRKGLDFWDNHLTDAYPTHFPLAADVKDECASRRPFSVPAIDSARIRKFCTQWQLMHPTIIHTAWSFVLSIYTGIKVPIFGTFCLGRDVPVDNSEKTWGPFIGLIPYKVALDRKQSIVETLQEAQKDYLTSMTFQHTSVAEIEQTPLFNGSKLFNSHITYQKAWSTDVSADDPLIIKYAEEWDPNDYDVGVRPIEGPEGIDIQLNFRVGCLKQTQAARLAIDYGNAISSILENPSMSFEQLKLSWP